jgi:hypothetical protein
MRRRILISAIAAGTALFLVSTGWADVPAPPANQSIGMLDAEVGSVSEADCRVCHSSGVPDRHHLLYDQPIPPGSIVPYPDSDGDGTPDVIYDCLNCHDPNFTTERDCVSCHGGRSPHHTTASAVDLQCTACHGDLVDNPYDGHYIPTYDPSLVTPYRGLDGDGFENPPWPTQDLASDGSGQVVPADVIVTTQGPPFFTATNIGPLGIIHTRSEPNDLSFKPAGDNNDFVIGSTHFGGETFRVVFTAGSTLAASWDAGTQTLSVTLEPTQIALNLVNEINAATGGVDVVAKLGFDGDDPAADVLPPEHYEPPGGAPANNRGFGAGSCSYCHDTDGILDANGHPDGLIWDNRTLHHDIGLPSLVSDGAGGTISKCEACHERATASEQSGPNFDYAIRYCERCHGPDSLHNIQADSNGDGTIVVGGEDAGYGHVGRDGGAGDSDCWGCHGFGVAKAALDSGPIIPTIDRVDRAAVDAGADTVVILSGSAFTNVADATKYTSEVALTAADGSVLMLAPDRLEQSSLEFTIPEKAAPGNYDVRAVKGDEKSNLAVISVRPEVIIVEATGRKTVTINGSGFGGYAKGSGTAVTGTRAAVPGWHRKTPIMEATIVSWSDTTIVAEFRSPPSKVTVNSVFGTAHSKVLRGSNGRGRRP